MSRRKLLLWSGNNKSSLLTGLVSYWKLEEASGTRNDSHGTNHLGVTGATGRTTGKIGYAPAFVGGTALTIDDNATLSFTGDFAIAFWVNLSQVAGSSFIVTKGTAANAGADEYWVAYTSSASRFRFAVSNGTTRTTVDAGNLGAPSALTWYFIVAWHDTTLDKIYIKVNDGTADSAAHSVGCQDSNNAFRIGSNNGTTYMAGQVDEVGVWNRVLTAAEMTSLYAGGAGKQYPF